tara:strand:+ start:996 stop:1349 length:354 start_codon:yes stop_codon:yes gene_type:complete
MTDYRALCKDLAEDLGSWMEYGHSPANLPFEEDCTYKLLKRTRAALAEQSEGPTDEELLELMPETMRDEFSYVAKFCADATDNKVKPGIFRVCLNTAALEYARAVLARYGGQLPVNS